MTRLAGRPATPAPTPKAPPRSSNQPKPRYVKIPAPNPAPVVNVRTGNNPRSTAIVTKAPPPKFITGGNNPRSVAIKPNKPVYAPVPKPKAPKPVKLPSLPGRAAALAGNPLAAIALHETTKLPHIALNALKDIRDFVPTTIEGIDTIAQAGAHDLLGVATGATHVGPGATPVKAAPQHSELKALGEQMWKSSITDKVVHGHFGEALHQLENHPVYGALEVAGGLGVVGRALGAAGRAGALGEHVAEVAKLAREDRPLLPGTPGLKRHGSKNLIVRVGQHAADKIELPSAIERRVVDHHVRKNVNDIAGIQSTMATGHGQEIIDEQHAAARGKKSGGAKVADRVPIVKNFIAHHIPKDRKEAADIAGYQAMGAASRKSALDDLQLLHDKIDAHLKDPEAKLTKVHRKAAEANRDNLATFLKDPNTQALNEINSSFLKRGAHQQADKLELGLLSEAQAETAPLHGAVAMGHVPGNNIRIATAEDGLTSVRKAAYLKADHDVKVATTQYHAAEIKAATMKPAARKAYLGLFKDNVKEAVAERKPLEEYKNEHVTGIVEDTAERLHGRNPVYAVRKVLAPEVRARLISVGRNPNDMGYVNMTAPAEKGELKAQAATRGLSRNDAAYHSRAAKGLTTGNTRPGAAMMLDSQLQAQRQIDRARGFDLLTRMEGHHRDGKLLRLDKHEAQAAKEQYAIDHPGRSATIIPLHSANSVNRLDDFVKSGGDFNPADEKLGYLKKERFGLMDSTAANHYLKHLNADNTGNGAWGAVNRAFRNTVLPLSPKWIAGNDIEGFIRSGLVGASPRDARIVGKVLKVMRSRGDHQAADTLESIMNGQHYSMASRRNHEALVADSLEHPDKQMLLRNRPGIKQLADVYMHGIVEPVFEFNRKIEGGFDRAVLGQHMHNQMLQFGANIKQAAMHEQQWIEKLADGYSDPALVMHAGRYIQKTLGQYSRFSPLAKRLVNTLFPFAPWYANALRFVYLTMPMDHPLVQSVLLAAGQTVQKEYASQFAAQGNLNDKVGGHRFGELGTSLAVQGGGLIDISRYMPWGAPSGGPIAMATAPVGPQLQGPALAMFAKEDAFGSPLKDKNGDITDTGDAALIGLNEFALSLAGPLDLADRIIVNHGSTPYSGTTIFNPELKPNSHRGAPGIVGGLERSTIPGYPTYLNGTGVDSGDGTTGVGVGGAAPIGRSGAATVGRSGAAVVGR